MKSGNCQNQILFGRVIDMKKGKECIGETINGFKVIDYKFENRQSYWNCECPFCKNKFWVRVHYIKSGEQKSCGCLRIKDIVGKRFGRLTVLSKAEPHDGLSAKEDGYPYICRCECGNIVRVTRSNLTRGHSKSCGCLKTEKYLQRSAESFGVDQGTNIYLISKTPAECNNSSGIRGVTWNGSKNKWCARITLKRKVYYLGSYADIKDAAKARKEAEENIHGSFLKWYAETYPEKWEKMQMKKKENA